MTVGNWKPLTIEEETRRIEDTLAVLLGEITRIDKGTKKNDRSSVQPPPVAISVSDISSVPELYWQMDKIAEAPVREACAATLTTIGRRLHEMGGIELMQTVHDRVVRRTRKHPNRWSMLLDKRWDGVGGEWWA
jgi:hypothetical protein